MSESPPTSLPPRVSITLTSLEEWINQVLEASRKVDACEAEYKRLEKERDEDPDASERYYGQLLTCALDLTNAKLELESIQKRFDPPTDSEVTLTRT